MAHPPYTPPPSNPSGYAPPAGPMAPGGYPAPPGGSGPRQGSPEVPSRGAVLGATVWRLAIVVCAFYGYGETDGGTLYALSQLASVVAGGCYALVAIAGLITGLSGQPEPPSSWLRGLLAGTLLLVMVTWFTLMEGDVNDTWSLFEHLVTPLLVLGDWMFVGRRQLRARWWYPFTWAAVLVVYLVVLIQSDRGIYDFLDPDDGDFATTVVGFLVGFLAAGYLLIGIGRLRATLSRPTGVRPGPGAAPVGSPWGQPAGPGYAPPVPQQPQAPSAPYPPNAPNPQQQYPQQQYSRPPQQGQPPRQHPPGR